MFGGKHAGIKGPHPSHKSDEVSKVDSLLKNEDINVECVMKDRAGDTWLFVTESSCRLAASSAGAAIFQCAVSSWIHWLESSCQA